MVFGKPKKVNFQDTGTYDNMGTLVHILFNIFIGSP